MRKFLKVLKIIGASLLSIIVLILLFIGIYSQIGNSKVVAKIEGLGTKLVVISYWPLDRSERHWKPAYCINDKIRLRVNVKETSKARLNIIQPRRTFRSKRIAFYLEPNDEIVLQGKNDSISIDYEVVKGNKLSKQFAELRKELLPFYIEESRLFQRNKELWENNKKQSNEITNQFNDLRFKTVAPFRMEWAKQHLDYEIAPLYLMESHVPADTMIKYSSLLSKNAKESYYGKILIANVAGLCNTKIGNIAPNFIATTIKENNFSLNQTNVKYLVLDFWGTWCGPCMYGVPKMKEYYAKYKSKVEFVGIACNDKESIWRETVETNQMNWIQILDENSINNIARLYGVGSYPTKFIINPQGEIINRFKGEVEEFYHELDSLMKKQTTANKN